METRNALRTITSGFIRSLALAGLAITLMPTAGDAGNIHCAANAAPPVAIPGKKISATAYVSCAGFPASISLCTTLQFAWKDSTGKWRYENRKKSCTTVKNKSAVVKTVTHKCIGGYYRTLHSETIVSPPHVMPPMTITVGASPVQRVRCF